MCTGKGERTELLFMANGALIGPLNRNASATTNTNSFASRFSPNVVRGGTGVVPGIDLHLSGALLPRGQGIQVG